VLFVATLSLATLVSFGAAGGAPYSATGVACNRTAVTTASDSGHVRAKAQYRRLLSKTTTNSTVRAIAQRLADDPKDADALRDFGEWCKRRYPTFRPIQQSDFEYD
jgi:hypothetical protein